MADDPPRYETYDEWTKASDDPWNQKPPDEPLDDQLLGQAAVMLMDAGDEEAASLLLDIVRFHTEVGSIEYWERADLTAYIEVEPYLTPRYTEVVIDRIHGALWEVASRGGRELGPVIVRGRLPEVKPNWREQLAARLANDQPTNQARTLRVVAPQWVEDGLNFSNDAELRVYQALKRAQANLTPGDSIAIFPLPSGYVLPSHTWEPDFLVTYKKRVGLIEVDGPQHAKRYAADASRDPVWRDAGIAHIERIVPDDTRDDATMDQFVGRFLRHLAS